MLIHWHWSIFCKKILSLIVVSILISISHLAHAQIVTTLHSFQPGSAFPRNPVKVIRTSDGNIYALACEGGATNKGCFFKIAPNGTMTVIHSFAHGTVVNDGASPMDMVRATDGNFYGVTYYGGSADKGVIFKITPNGTVTILHHFLDGSIPEDGYTLTKLIQGGDGNFYGITKDGGHYGFGILFKLTNTGTYSILHSFGDSTLPNDGKYANSLIYASDGCLYGVTNNGGASNMGVLFKTSTTGSTSILHSFRDGTVSDDGQYPAAITQGADGFFYILCSGGGANWNGALNKIASDGTTTLLYSFVGTIDGNSPNTLIKGSDNNVYGTAYTGGSEGLGTAFKITVSGQFTLLHTFEDGSVAHDGGSPMTSLYEGFDGYFYGACYYGGNNDFGTIYKMSPAGTVTLVSSLGGFEGYGPDTSLLQASDGNFYGTCYYSTSVNDESNGGAIYKMVPDGTTSVIHAFNDGSVTNDGVNPSSALVQSSGYLYGVTSNGGSAGDGTIYKTSTTGDLTILHHFNDGSVTNDGSHPIQIIAASDGSFYGITAEGGSAGYGVIFKMTPSGTVTILHHFNDGSIVNDGKNPLVILQGVDGNLYGITRGGGAHTLGTVYKITTAGALSLVYSFDIGAKGNTPCSLIQGADGSFYGTTKSGGAAGYGVIFKLTTSGTVTVLHNYGDGSITNDAIGEYGSYLMQASDGFLYGVSYDGGSIGSGALFKCSVAGTMSIVHSFGDNTVPADSASSCCPLIQGTDGNLYGTGSEGGVTNYGAIYRYGISSQVQLMWVNASNRLGLWDCNVNTGAATKLYYGPYTGWTPKAIATGQDGNTRILWNYSNGLTSIWTLNNATGSFTNKNFGPYAGWSALGIAVGQDNIAHLLWKHTSGLISVWNLDGTGAAGYSSFNFGPFAGWSCTNITVGFDNIVHLLWRNTAGLTTVYNVDWKNPADFGTFSTYNTSGWTPIGFDCGGDYKLQMLWNRTANNQVSLWGIDPYTAANTPLSYGPLSGWVVTGSATSASENYILWYNATAGKASLWNVAANGTFTTSLVINGMTGWTPVMITARH